MFKILRHRLKTILRAARPRPLPVPPVPLSQKSLVVSYPRSGSNYLQEIFRTKLGINSTSLYADPSVLNPAVNLKSHAVSPAYLEDEIRFILGEPFAPKKIIAIYRDPRDTMISFYNFFLSRKQGSVDQAAFLEVDWFLAFARSVTCQTWLRSTYLMPLSVADAYRVFIDSWIISDPEPDKFSVLKIKYEELKAQPDLVVSSICDLLGCQRDKAPERLEDISLVSQYSNENRPRGVAHGWKDNQVYQDYKSLIMAVEKRFPNELHHLGYASVAE